MNYHRQTADSLEALHVNLQDRIVEATNRPRKEHVPKRVASSLHLDRSPQHNDFGGSNSLSAPSYSSYASSKGAYTRTCVQASVPVRALLLVGAV